MLLEWFQLTIFLYRFTNAAAEDTDTMNVDYYCPAGKENLFDESICRTSPSEFENYRAYREHFIRPLDPEMWRSRGVVYWGVFAARKENITWRGLNIYQELMRSISNDTHPEAAHFVERMWVDLFLGSLGRNQLIARDQTQIY